MPEEIGQIDLLFIDGPPIAFGEEIRGQSSRLFDRLSPQGMVMLDDAARPGERRIAERWAKAYPNLRQIYLAAEKGALLLTRQA